LGLLAAALAAIGSNPLAAQSGARTGGGVIRDAVLGRTGQSVPRNDPRYETRYPYDPPYEAGTARGKVKGNGGGPPFCRNGQGHPTKGRQWCVDKGWGGAARPVYGRQREVWDDVIYRNPAPRQDRRERQSTVGGILGDIILGRRGG
jgi:hypothetical protein